MIATMALVPTSLRRFALRGAIARAAFALATKKTTITTTA